MGRLGSSPGVSHLGSAAIYVGLPVTAHNNTNLCASTFDNVWSTAPAGTWQHQDIGSVGRAGNASYVSNPFAIAGSGADIWGNADAFNYTFLPGTGDCTLVARVTSVQNTDPWAKAGVMLRQDLTAGSAQAMMVITPGNNASFQWRPAAGRSMSFSQVTGVSAPYWVKLLRAGNKFSGYISADGSAWSQVGATQSITMASAVYAGLAVTAHNNSSLCLAAFDNVTAPGWTNWTLPAVPAGLMASAGDSQVALSWAASTNGTSYNVKRAATNGGPYAIVTNVATTNYTDLGLSNGTDYYYVVSALNPAGESANSAQAAATPQAPPWLSASRTGTNLTFSWPLAATGFSLQSRTNLILGNWEAVTSPPQVVGDQWQVMVAPTADSPSVFYRLSR